jgi:hypothetical protein
MTDIEQIVTRFETSYCEDDRIQTLMFFHSWLRDNYPMSVEQADDAIKAEGLAASASDYIIRFLKSEKTVSLALDIIQLLTPVDVLCGSSRRRSFVYSFGGRDVTIVTGNQEDIGLGFKVWPSAERALSLIGSEVMGRHIIELGAGVGLLSVCAGFSGALSVVATDYSEGCLDLCNENYKLNIESSFPFRTRLLDWNNVGTIDLLEDLPRGSYVIGTDTIYYPEHTQILYDTIRYMFESEIASYCLLVLGKRPGVTEFLKLMELPTHLWAVQIDVTAELVQLRIRAT